MSKLKFHSYKASDPYSDEGPIQPSSTVFEVNEDNPFVKELTQNSLDARIDRKTTVKISLSLSKVPKSEIPGFHDFEKRLAEMKKYWLKKSDQYKSFFENVEDVLKGKYVEVLAFEDFGTKGLDGDDRNGRFSACVNDENVSNKHGGGARGSFGMGKNSVFKYSSLQTVFYCTIDERKQCKFKGVSKLGTYEFDDVKRDTRIYYGQMEGDRMVMVTEKEEIPFPFRRSEQGLSQFVIGVSKRSQNWKENAIKEFLKNYWVSFEKGDLIVQIDGTEINEKNYYELAKNIFYEYKRGDQTPLPYIHAFKHGRKYEKDIHLIGKTILWLNEEDESDIRYYNRIEHIRGGMRIFLKDRLGVGGLPKKISGVFYCTNNEGEEILGAMEPPTHNAWKSDYIENKTVEGKRYSKRDAEKILNGINDFIRETINLLKKEYGSETIQLPFVDEIFQFVAMKSASGGDGSQVTSSERFRRRNKDLQFETVVSSSGRSKVYNGTADKEYVSGDGKGYGDGSGGSREHKGKGIRPKSRTGGGLTKSGKDISSMIKVPRFILVKDAGIENKYKLILSPHVSAQNIQVNLEQVGDNMSKTQFSGIIRSVKQNGKDLPVNAIKNSDGVTQSYWIKDISLEKEEPSVLDLSIEGGGRGVYRIAEIK